MNAVYDPVNFAIEEEQEKEEQMAQLESENFAVYSNFDFLLLIGTYSAQFNKCSKQGLTSLNDYILILDYNKNTYKSEDYMTQRALALYYMGMIYMNMKEPDAAMKFFPSCLEQLSKDPALKRKYEDAQKHVSEYWMNQSRRSTVNYF